MIGEEKVAKWLIKKQRPLKSIYTIKLFCIIDGDSTAFSVKIEPEDSVDDLKDAIKKKQSPLFDDIRASDLILWSVDVADEGIPVHLDHVESKTQLAKSTKSIKIVFGENLAADTIHCIDRRPAAAVLEPTPRPASLISRPVSPSRKLIMLNVYPSFYRYEYNQSN
ncbi:hypothetical protein BGX26_003324 [Mortierella sp. AD094]|nr:hypothetical protein BGX26_003324 [Mortierella sp. AD094]